jgi:hypothetical protein
MELTAGITSLELDLKCIELEITKLSPIPCRKDLELAQLLKTRDQIKKSIEILKLWESTHTQQG